MCSEDLRSPTGGQDHLPQSPFYSKMLNVSCNSLNTVLKVKNTLCGYRKVLSVWVVCPCNHEADWEPWLEAAAQKHDSISDCVLQARGKQSKFKVRRTVLPTDDFCTIIKPRNHELNNHKSGTICNYSYPAYLTKYLAGSDETTFKWRYFLNCKVLHVKCYQIVNNKKRIILSTS